MLKPSAPVVPVPLIDSVNVACSPRGETAVELIKSPATASVDAGVRVATPLATDATPLACHVLSLSAGN